jgi:hypothetical protein
MFPEMAINKLQPRGVTFVVCNVAHTLLSGMLGQKVGMTRMRRRRSGRRG